MYVIIWKPKKGKQWFLYRCRYRCREPFEHTGEIPVFFTELDVTQTIQNLVTDNVGQALAGQDVPKEFKVEEVARVWRPGDGA